MNVSAELQATLDATGKLGPTPYLLYPEVPLFIDRPEVEVSGLKVNGWTCGTFAVIGHRRGLVGDECFPPGGFRTCGGTDRQAHLVVQDGFNCGPLNALPGPLRGWSSQSRFRIRFQGESHGPEGWTQRKTPGGDYTHSFLFGMYGFGGGWEASPWYLVWTIPPAAADLTLTLIFKTSDGDVNFLKIPADRLTPQLEIDLSVDLAAGTAWAQVNGHGVSPVYDHPPTAPTLADNFLFPFCLGKMERAVNTSDAPAPVLDFTTRELLYAGDHGFGFLMNLQYGRPQTYPGGPGLPLVPFGGPAGTRYAHAVHHTQGAEDQAVGLVHLHNLKVTGTQGNPVVVVRCLNNKLDLDRVYVDGGSCGILMDSPGGTVYQTTLRDCHMSGQLGYQVRGYRAHVTVRDSVMGRAHQGVTHTRGGNVALENVFIPAPGPPSAPYVFHQSGGRASYINCHANYEKSDVPALVDLIPATWDALTAQTDVLVERCILDRVAQPLVLQPRQYGYVGEVNINVDGARRLIRNEGGVDVEYTSGNLARVTRAEP